MFLAIVSIFDFLLATISSFRQLYGSIPSFKKEVFMVKFNVVRMLKSSEFLLNHWVTKASLLALGLWLLPPRPYEHFY